MSENTDKLQDERHEAVMRAFQRVEGKFDALDARTRVVENKLSVLAWAYGVGTAVFGAIAAKLGWGH